MLPERGLTRVAEILAAVADPPNERRHPIGGDRPGNFHAWFDGGAIEMVTGYTIYHFHDGARATILTTPSLNVSVQLADGSRVSVVEQT